MTASLVFREIFLVQARVSMTDTVQVYTPEEEIVAGDSVKVLYKYKPAPPATSLAINPYSETEHCTNLH